MKKTRLSDIFNADSIRNRKRILDRFEINKKEKRLFLDAIEENKSSGGGSNDVEYISFKDELSSELLGIITALSLSVKIELKQEGIIIRLVISPYTYAKVYSQQVPLAVKINRNEKTNALVGTDDTGNPIIKTFTVIEYLSMISQSFIDKFNSLPRLTEEEFYNTNI